MSHLHFLRFHSVGKRAIVSIWQLAVVISNYRVEMICEIKEFENTEKNNLVTSLIFLNPLLRELKKQIKC